MRTILVLASSAVAAATFAAGVAVADDRLHVSPPITREHARAIQAAQPAGELTVTPQPVAASRATVRVTATSARVEIADR